MERSVQDRIATLKSKIDAKSGCMRDNQCMSGKCPKRKRPVNCFNKLESWRGELKELESSIVQYDGEQWTGIYSVTAKNNNPW